jgi:hypothetical protein
MRVRKPGLDHFEDARLAGAPVTVHTDRDRLGTLITKQLDDRRRDRFVVQQVYARFIVGKDHRCPSTRRARQIGASARRSISAFTGRRFELVDPSIKNPKRVEGKGISCAVHVPSMCHGYVQQGFRPVLERSTAVWHQNFRQIMGLD